MNNEKDILNRIGATVEQGLEDTTKEVKSATHALQSIRVTTELIGRELWYTRRLQEAKMATEYPETYSEYVTAMQESFELARDSVKNAESYALAQALYEPPYFHQWSGIHKARPFWRRGIGWLKKKVDQLFWLGVTALVTWYLSTYGLHDPFGE